MSKKSKRQRLAFRVLIEFDVEQSDLAMSKKPQRVKDILDHLKARGLYFIRQETRGDSLFRGTGRCVVSQVFAEDVFCSWGGEQKTKGKPQ